MKIKLIIIGNHSTATSLTTIKKFLGYRILMVLMLLVTWYECITFIESLTKTNGCSNNQADALFRDVIAIIVEICPVLNEATLENMFRSFLVEEDQLLSTEMFEAILRHRAVVPADTTATQSRQAPLQTRQKNYWAIARSTKHERIAYFMSFWKRSSTDRTCLYATNVEPTKLNPQFYIFKSVFADLKTSPIFGFDHMSGFEFINLLAILIRYHLFFIIITNLRTDSVSADNYDGPFLEVVSIWRAGMTDIITNMAKLCNTMGCAFDKKKCEDEVITLANLPENLNVYLNDTFEKRLVIFEASLVALSGFQGKQVKDVRDGINLLCNKLLSHEIQAIFASLQNDNHYSILDVFRNFDGDVLSVQDFLVRFSVYKLATVYPCGYISTRFPDLVISNTELFVIFKSGDGNSVDYLGHRLPSFQFAFRQAELHLNKVYRYIYVYNLI
jgi:hypothetical protein